MAQEARWDGSESTDWENAANWSTGTVPTADAGLGRPLVGTIAVDTGVVQTPVVTSGQDVSVRTLNVGFGDDGTIEVQSGGRLQIGDAVNGGSLNIGQTTNIFGVLDFSTGLVTLSGGDLEVFGTLNLGASFGSTGTLQVQNGGTVRADSLCLACGGSTFAGTGLIEVAGPGSNLEITSGAGVIRIGESTGTGGTGTLNITNGGSAAFAGGVGDILGVGSTISVDGSDGAGTGSRLTWNGLLTAHGDISVTNGAVMESGNLTLTDTASLTVSGGAQLNQITGDTSNWGIAQQTGVLVTGAGTELTLDGALSINSSNLGAGSADVVISDGAVVTVNSASQSGLGFGEERLLQVSDATLTMTGGLLMNRGTLEATNATLNFGAGSLSLGSFFAGNSLTLLDTDITAGLIATNVASATLGNVINLGGTASGPAGAVGVFDVGTVTLNGGAAGAQATEFVLNHTATDYEIASVFSGSGGTIRHLAGDTVLTGDSASFGTSTSTPTQTLVTGGTLTLDGRLGGNAHEMIVSDGATLGGSGTVGGLLTLLDGHLAPGNSPGTFTVAGDLALDAASILDFELGAPTGTPGIDSDLIEVSGNLTLDGTLNVTDVGGFGSGLYRLVNYGGALTDNGLDLGTTPTGFSATDLTVQTAVANQVNLLVVAPVVTTGFLWDGANTTANGAVDGGSGTWSATGTNWTNADGSANGIYDPVQGLIFTGAGGTVTVDGTAGTITVNQALQFAADGFVLAGDDIVLTDDIVVRVGDGTAAGAGTTAVLQNNLTGAGGLEFTDLGTLILDGTMTYAGNTEVNAGQMLVNGSLASPETFVLGGRLGGTGQITGTTFVNPGGTLAAGDPTVTAGPIGTLGVDDVVFAAGSVLEVQIDDGGNVAGVNNDLIDASGTATINGGTIHVTPGNGTDDGSTYTPGTTYTVLRTDSGLTGSFDSVTDDFALLDFTDSYDADTVFITSALIAETPAGACDTLSLTFNQDATCGGVLSVGSGELHTAVVNLSNAEIAGALDQLSGEIHASIQSAMVEDSRFPREAAMSRLRAGNAGLAAPTTPGVWGQGFASNAAWGGDGNAADFDRGIAGFFLGADTVLSNDLRLGAFAGRSSSDFDLDARGSNGSADSLHLGVYGGTTAGPATLRFGAAYGWHDIATSRSVAFTGFADSLDSAYEAKTGQVFAEVGYGLDHGTTRFEPFANLARVHFDTASVTENGGSGALAGEGSSIDTTFATLGLRTGTKLDLGGSAAAIDTLVGWRHAFGDLTPSAVHSFAGGTDFRVAGAAIVEDVLEVGFGATVALSENATLAVSYNGQFGSDFRDQKIVANFAMSF